MTARAIDPTLDLTLQRVIRASPDAIWRAWTDPSELERWWVPAPTQARAEQLDVRPGGGFVTSMRDDDGEFLPLLSVAPLLREGDGEEALDHLLEAVRAHIPGGQLNDDLAVLLVEHLADDVEPASWPAVRTLGRELADR